MTKKQKLITRKPIENCLQPTVGFTGMVLQATTY